MGGNAEQPGHRALEPRERTGKVSKLKLARNAIEAAFETYMLAGQKQYRVYFEDRLREIDRNDANLTQDSSV
jgi:hypothetical protein